MSVFMDYSLEEISTTSAYDALLAMAQKKKQQLERQRRNLGELIGDFAERVDYLTRELAMVQSVLETFTTAYKALPEGKYKLDMNIQLTRVELRKARLENRARYCNVQSLLAKQLKYNRLGNQVLAIDRYIATLQSAKAALGNAPARVSPVEMKPLPNLSFTHAKSRYKTGRLRVASFSGPGRRQLGIVQPWAILTRLSQDKPVSDDQQLRQSSRPQPSPPEGFFFH